MCAIYLKLLWLFLLMQIVQLPPPYGTCEQEEDYVYTKCILQCKSEYVIDKCGCKDMNMFG